MEITRGALYLRYGWTTETFKNRAGYLQTFSYDALNRMSSVFLDDSGSHRASLSVTMLPRA